MIQIKAWYGDWRAVDRGKARAFIRHMMAGIITTSDPIKKAALLDGNHLRGITVAELLTE